MNVKLKARIAILKSYMTLMGFKNITVHAIVRNHGKDVTYQGKKQIDLSNLAAALKTIELGVGTDVFICFRGYHTGLNDTLALETDVGSMCVWGGSDERLLIQCIDEAEHCIQKALYEKAKAKAVIPAAELL